MQRDARAAREVAEAELAVAQDSVLLELSVHLQDAGRAAVAVVAAESCELRQWRWARRAFPMELLELVEILRLIARPQRGWERPARVYEQLRKPSEQSRLEAWPASVTTLAVACHCRLIVDERQFVAAAVAKLHWCVAAQHAMPQRLSELLQ
jgi:hypothetical protein